MAAIVTVFKDEFKDHPDLIPTLAAMSSEVRELHDAYVYSPKPGMLVKFLNTLQRYNIPYGTHFKNVDDLPT